MRGYYQKKLETTYVDEDTEKKESLGIGGGNVNWHSCYGTVWISFKKLKTDHTIQQFHFWVFTEENVLT